MPVILLVILSFLGVMSVLYRVVRSAIDQSNMAKDIKTIKAILIAELAQTEFVNDEEEKTTINLCPNCGEKLDPKAKQCPRCKMFVRSQ